MKFLEYLDRNDGLASLFLILIMWAVIPYFLADIFIEEELP